MPRLQLIWICLLIVWCGIAQAATPDNGTINVRDFGATGDGVTDDTAAIQAAAKAAEIFRSEPSLIGGTVQAGPTLVFPAGKYIIHDEIKLNVLEVRGEGRPIIHQTNPDKDILTTGAAWRLSVRNMAFSGGRNQINFYNVNLDNGLIVIDHCQFYGASGFAIRTDVLSTMVQITQCIFLRNHQTWYNGRSDQAVMRDCWITAGHGTSDKAAIEHRGDSLTIENICGVPEPHNGVRQRWIDNHGNSLYIRSFRFGAEGGGFTPIYNFSRYNPAVYGRSIVVENSGAFANSSITANCLIYCYEIPNTIRIHNTTLGGAQGVIVDPAIDLSNYFQAESASLFAFRMDNCTGAFANSLPAGLDQPIVHERERPATMLTDEQAKEALARAVGEWAALPETPFTGGEENGHTQQVDPASFIEVEDWTIAGKMDATAQDNADWLMLEKVASDVLILLKQPQPGGWSHATAYVEVDLDEHPFLTWKLSPASAPGAFVMKVIDRASGESGVVAGTDAWGKYGTGAEYRYYARNLRDLFTGSGQRKLEIRLYPIASYVWDERSGQAGEYIVVDFMRMEAGN